LDDIGEKYFGIRAKASDQMNFNNLLSAIFGGSDSTNASSGAGLDLD
jgi:hypothetical protein